jgi:Ca2+-transporting ATPase
VLYSNYTNKLSSKPTRLILSFRGLGGVYDPQNRTYSVIQQFYEAGIQVKVVTGDNTVTTKTIAEMAGIKIPRTLWKVKRL